MGLVIFKHFFTIIIVAISFFNTFRRFLMISDPNEINSFMLDCRHRFFSVVLFAQLWFATRQKATDRQSLIIILTSHSSKSVGASRTYTLILPEPADVRFALAS